MRYAGTQSTVFANGTHLWYEITGASDAPLVLVHGSWGDHHNWDAVVPGLARSFRVLTYDRRGHSLSARPSTQGSLGEDAMDLAALLETLGLAPAHVVGNSGGAAVGLWLAAQRPDVLRSLVVHEPPLFALLSDDASMQAPLAAASDRVRAVLHLLQSGNDAAAAERFVDTIAFGPGAWSKMAEEKRHTFITNAPTFLDELMDPQGVTVDLDALRRYTGPALLTRGERSAPFFPAVVIRLSRELPQARQHLFSDAGHVPHITHPGEYVEVVTRFIQGAAAGEKAGTAREIGTR